jgi:hypothetical protein
MCLLSSGRFEYPLNLFRFSGWLGIAALIGNTFGSEMLRIPATSPGVCLPPGLFLNAHKIRVDSDNKRLAPCTKMALTECKKGLKTCKRNYR